jgi:hypothetical protein
MPAQKKTIKVLMFLLPAIVSLLAYTAFHEMLFRKPPCLINCDQPGLFSDNEKLKKWLAFLESLRDDPFNTKLSGKRTSPTPLDIAFLQDKINVARNDRDYLTRYQQIISDLTSPYVIEESNENKDGLTEKIAPLAYLTKEKDVNNQVFASPLERELDSNISPFTTPKSGPYFVPGGNGSPFVASDTNPITDGNETPGGGGADGEVPNNGGPSGGGTPSTGPVIGGGGPNTGNNNPISTVPTPKSAYLVLGLLVAIGAIRFRVLQRKNILRF